ncbi:response regulator transcription factor [Rhizobium helianthi]|uniref:Response regulator transcription factor n=1 Tax=Rhizobium helianthi TaxID=1132695 RepID=A0ABW4M0M5_9HYPH
MTQSFSTIDFSISLIGAVGRSGFHDALVQSLRRLIGFDAGLVLHCRHKATPTVLHNDWTSQPRATLTDEFNYVFVIDSDTRLMISLHRSELSCPFTGEETNLLQSVSSIIEAAVIRHWRDLQPQLSGEEAGTVKSALAQAIGSFGRSILTERECEVAQLVLRGYSLKGAARLLGISPATIKLHRRNVYAKLDVSSQTELFSLFIDAVSSTTNHDEDPLVSYVARRSSLSASPPYPSRTAA